METKWAEENLQTIRTLMERSAVYRRALAPIMIFVGSVGIVGGIMGWQFEFNSVRSFVLFWTGAALLALVGSLLLVRQQALKDSEPFWSSPARQVARAMFPTMFIGLVISAAVVTFWMASSEEDIIGIGYERAELLIEVLLMIGWMYLFGCAINAAGFFVSVGIKLFGWLFIMFGCGLLGLLVAWAAGWTKDFTHVPPHLLMATAFGGLHLTYGIYLYFTEKKNSAA